MDVPFEKSIGEDSVRATLSKTEVTLSTGADRDRARIGAKVKRCFSLLGLVACVVLLLFILSACGSNSAAPISAPTPMPTSAPTPTPTPSPTPTAPIVAKADDFVKGQPSETPEPTPELRTFILNTNTHKYHKPTCSSVKQIKDKNRSEFTGTREEVEAMGFEPCARCGG